MRSRLCRLPTLALVIGLGFLAQTLSAPARADEDPSPSPTDGSPVGEGDVAATSDAAKAPAPPIDPTIDRRVLSVDRGDTLLDLLTDADVPTDQATGAIAALRKVYDPRKLRVGQQLTVLFEPRRGGPKRFLGLEFAPDVVRSVAIERSGDNDFTSVQTAKTVVTKPTAARGVIRSSLFEAGGAAGVPASVMMALIQEYSYDVDFQRDLQPGDRFEVLYERQVTTDDQPVGEGDVLYAALTLSGKEYPIYRHKGRNGRTDYYNRDGESIRRALLRTPVDGARITSSFGMRHHPILGFTKMHKGVDFGAPTGTPIYAAGRGVIEIANRVSGYGNYIRIRHNTEIETAYAHLSRYGKGIARGVRVDQGEVIGYVGATGRATGPHLHYEVLRDGKQVNPKSIDLPTGDKLEGRELEAFHQTVKSLDAEFRDARNDLQLARMPVTGDAKGCTGATTC